MQSKFENFNDLPEELKIETVQNLSNRELVNLSVTSKYHLNLFQPLIDVRKLLHHVTRGEHDMVTAMLKKDINLFFKWGEVTDCSGREFENISGFEYALWALDKHMWAAMIECIPQNEEGRKVFAQLNDQYNIVNTDGVIYRLNGKTITEKHFDFENTIIKELQTQVDSLSAPGEKNWDAINKQWQEGVGGAQKRLPVHIVYEYCSNKRFYPVPEFASQPKSSKQFYNLAIDKHENWFGWDSRLSIDFAIYKGQVGLSYAVKGRCASGWRVLVAHNLDAMTALCQVRTNDFVNLKSQLEDQMTADNHHQVSQI